MNILKKKKYQYEIIVVDDGSTDSTIDVVNSIKNKKIKVLTNKKNMGKGYSVKKGILNAKYPLVLFSDSDLSTPIEELEKFLDHIDDYDIVIASRNMRGSVIKVKQPFYRQWLGKTFPFLVNLIVLDGFNDTQCGFKLYKTDVAKKVVAFQRLHRWSFDVEVLYIAKKMGYKIKEAPVVWIDKKGSKVNPLADGIRMLFDMFRIIFNNLAGRYGG